jgi:hypothetical protein
MARIIGCMKMLDEADIPQSQSGKHIYPWDEWSDGKPREAERGIDYQVPDRSFAAIIRGYARRNKIPVSTWTTDAGIGFVFTRPAKPADHNCTPSCPIPCPQDDDDPRGWQG